MLVRSMTGFGQSTVTVGETSLTVEVRSVNHRFAEFSVRLPRELLVLEEAVRKCLSQFIVRGRIDVYVAFGSSLMGARQVKADWTLLDALHALEVQARERYGLTQEPATLLMEWLKYPDVVRVESGDVDIETIRDGVVRAVQDACEALVLMRSREGERLAADLQTKAQDLALLVQQISNHAPQVVSGFRERLHKRLRESQVVVDENRFAAEVALLADRAAIDEEVVRLTSHLEEFRNSVVAGSPVGRRLDFIVQELQRELNTIASKCSDLLISRVAVDCKAIVEQMREQVQNIE